MPTVILLRHGRTTANSAGVLAGWSPGVGLDPTGRTQVAAVAERLASVPLAAIVSSPLQRCRQTAAAVVAVPGPHGSARPQVELEVGLGEVRYGTWTGRALSELAKEPLWRVVQNHPSAATFPEGESLAAMQARAVAALRRHNLAVEQAHGPDAIWLAVSHGDVIKAIIADAMGTHLDSFQRIVVDTASISILRYSELRPFVVRVNDGGNDLSDLVPSASTAAAHAASDAVVGGSTE